MTHNHSVLAKPGSSSYLSEVLADSPLMYWKCDETSGSTLFDSSGNGRDGSKDVNTTFGQPAVRPNAPRAIDLAGTGSSDLAIADAAWESPHAGASGQMTLESWAQSDTLAAINTLWWKGAASNFEFSLAFLTTGAVQFGMFTAAGGTAATAQSAAGVVTAGTPYHVVGTYDRAANFCKVYINGSEVGTTTTSADSADGTANLIYGLRISSGDRYFNGRTSDLAMYGTALSAARILAHYNAG